MEVSIDVESAEVECALDIEVMEYVFIASCWEDVIEFVSMDTVCVKDKIKPADDAPDSTTKLVMLETVWALVSEIMSVLKVGSVLETTSVLEAVSVLEVGCILETVIDVGSELETVSELGVDCEFKVETAESAMTWDKRDAIDVGSGSKYFEGTGVGKVKPNAWPSGPSIPGLGGGLC